MAEHPWSSLVVGGVERPRFIICDTNFCEDPYFMSGLGEWDTSNAPDITLVEDDKAYEQYMAHLTYAMDNQWVDFGLTLTESAINRLFLVSIRIRALQSFKMAIIISDGGNERQFGNWVYSQTGGAGSEPVKLTFTGLVTEVVGDGTNLKLRIWPHFPMPLGGGNLALSSNYVDPSDEGIWAAGDADIYFDDLYITEASADITFPHPNDQVTSFNESTIGQNKLWNGIVQKFNKRYVPEYSSEYEALDTVYEQYRQLIAEAAAVFCIPHIDVAWGFLGYWSDDVYQREYAFGRFIGHASKVSITGQEYHRSKPSLVAGVAYVEDDIIVE